MSINSISIHKANVHNLKNISLEIPKNSLVVITGPSGSGKSSLAFDTLYVEGQRRYIESLSSYARQFLGQFAPPDVESIKGLSPTIAIDQKTNSRNPRSTVGTITEIYDYLRILYAKIGIPYCPKCHQAVEGKTAQQISQSILLLPIQSKIQILAPLAKGKKGEFKDEFEKFKNLGFSKIRIDKNIHSLEEDIKLNKNQKHNVEVVIDRIILKDGAEKRVSESVELALKLGEGQLILTINDRDEVFYSETNTCLKCDISFPKLEPRTFSFNSPIGACPACNGLGETNDFNMELMYADKNLSIEDGGIAPLAKKNSFFYQMVKCMAKQEKISLATPVSKLPPDFLNSLIHGSEKVYAYNFKSENSTFNFKKQFPGILSWLHKKYNETASDKVRDELKNFMLVQVCSKCKGGRLNPFALATKIKDKTINDLSLLSIDHLYEFIQNHNLKGDDLLIAKKLLKEISERLSFLKNVGLNYLNLHRSAMTLSGGESQRIRLATQIGSSLTGVLYILDEPSIGLHSRDNSRLIKTLKSLKDLGNTVIVVEHDEDTIKAADHIIDMGPGAGSHGGQIIAQGNLSEILSNKDSLTGNYLNKKLSISRTSKHREAKDFLFLKGANAHNLKKIDVKVPLHQLVAITGVSGSGKSTLVHDILVPALKVELKKEHRLTSQKNYSSISGFEKLTNIIELDQNPIGRTPKSNPATYTGLFDPIRQLFAQTIEAKTRGYMPGRFSFNVKGGRCEACEGNGEKKIEMHFLPDVSILCSDCNGKRYNKDTLSVHYRGRNISDVLNMTVDDAVLFFQNHNSISRILLTLQKVGLGYMKLGQAATTLSGGEAQRLKLARELGKSTKEHCLYILDEPTTGLHFHDIDILLKAIHGLVDFGHSVIVIEHNMDVIKTADTVIDLGPEGGEYGGQIVAIGSPQEISESKTSHTGKYLKKILALS